VEHLKRIIGVDKSVNVIGVVSIPDIVFNEIYQKIRRLFGRFRIHVKKLDKKRKRQFLYRLLLNMDDFYAKGLDFWAVLLMKPIKRLRKQIPLVISRIIKSYYCVSAYVCTNLDVGNWILADEIRKILGNVKVFRTNLHEAVEIADAITNLYRYCRECVFGKMSHLFIRRLTETGRVIII